MNANSKGNIGMVQLKLPNELLDSAKSSKFTSGSQTHRVAAKFKEHKRIGKFCLPHLTPRARLSTIPNESACKGRVILSDYFIKRNIDSEEFKQKTKLLNYRTGYKYLLKPEESLHEKHKKIQNKIFSTKPQQYTKEQNTRKLADTRKENLELEYLLTKTNTTESSVDEYFKEPLFLGHPCDKGMNALRRKKILQNELPYMYLANKLDKQQKAVENREVMRNFFSFNLRSIPKYIS